MASLNVVEFAQLGREMKGRDVPVGGYRTIASKVVSYTTATQSDVFDSKSHFVRLIADADVYIAFGDNPTATSASMRLAADVSEYFEIKGGQRLSAYDGTS